MFFFFFSIKDPICLKLVKYFCCYSASTKSIFGFCSCSEFLQLKFGKKKSQGNASCSAPKTVIWLTKVANEIYLPYDVMKGWGSVSISAGLLFPFHEKVEQKFETTSNHYSGASNTKFLKKNVYKKKINYHHYYHHYHHQS